MKRNNGKFATGNKGGGRPTGSKNKETKVIRERITNLLDMNWKAIQEDLNELTPKERIDAYIKLLEYAVPKLQRTELANGETEKITISFED